MPADVMRVAATSANVSFASRNARYSACENGRKSRFAAWRLLKRLTTSSGRNDTAGRSTTALTSEKIGGVDADAERERDERDGGEAGGFGELAEGVAEVGEHGVN